MSYLYRRLCEDGKNWREIYKALLVLDHILKNGSEEAVNIALGHVIDVKTLQSFQKIDDNGKDVGVNVRERAKHVTELLTDTEYLKQARLDAKNQKKDYGGVGNYGSASYNSYGSAYDSASYSSNYDRPTTSTSYETYGTYSDTKQSYGPGSYKDSEQSQQPEPVEAPQPEPVQQKQADLFSFDSAAQPAQKQSSSDLFDFGSTSQQPAQSSSNLFDFGSTKGSSANMFNNTPSQQRAPQMNTSTNLFDAPAQQPKQQTSTASLFNTPTQGSAQPSTMDLFGGLTVQPAPAQQPQAQPVANDNVFGDFSSAQPAQKSASDWRANITIDSLDDKRKQPARPAQQKQTLGSLL